MNDMQADLADSIQRAVTHVESERVVIEVSEFIERNGMQPIAVAGIVSRLYNCFHDDMPSQCCNILFGIIHTTARNRHLKIHDFLTRVVQEESIVKDLLNAFAFTRSESISSTVFAVVVDMLFYFNFSSISISQFEYVQLLASAFHILQDLQSIQIQLIGNYDMYSKFTILYIEQAASPAGNVDYSFMQDIQGREDAESWLLLFGMCRYSTTIKTSTHYTKLNVVSALLKYCTTLLDYRIDHKTDPISVYSICDSISTIACSKSLLGYLSSTVYTGSISTPLQYIYKLSNALSTVTSRILPAVVAEHE